MKKLQEEPTWDDYYRNEEVEKMHWYYKDLDPDLKEAIAKLGINKGRFLDVGTGPGTQAVELAKMGFDVTGSDISLTAIEKAKKLSDKVKFIVDDILKSKIPEKSFDYIFDRGFFHTLKGDDRKRYIEIVYNMLSENGILFLKTFSTKQEESQGPVRYSKEDIEQLFSSKFTLEDAKETVYQGPSKNYPKSIFCILKKK